MFHSVPGVPRVQKWNALPACCLLAGIPFKACIIYEHEKSV